MVRDLVQDRVVGVEEMNRSMLVRTSGVAVFAGGGENLEDQVDNP